MKNFLDLSPKNVQGAARKIIRTNDAAWQLRRQFEALQLAEAEAEAEANRLAARLRNANVRVGRIMFVPTKNGSAVRDTRDFKVTHTLDGGVRGVITGLDPAVCTKHGWYLV